MAPGFGSTADNVYVLPGLISNKKSFKGGNLLRRPRAPKILPELSAANDKDDIENKYLDLAKPGQDSNSIIRLFQDAFELEALQDVIVDPTLLASGGSREPSLASPPPPSESDKVHKTRQSLDNSRSAQMRLWQQPLERNAFFIEKDDLKYILDPLLRGKTSLGTYVDGKSLAKPFKSRGPDPLPRRPPRRPVDLRLNYDVDDPRYFQPPAFTLEYFVYKLAEKANMSVPRVRKVVYSRHNVKKLTDMLAREINPPSQSQLHTITVDGTNVPAKENRIPRRQLLYEMAALLKLHIKEMTGSEMKSTIRPVSKFSSHPSATNKPSTEIVLYEDDAAIRASAASRIIQQTEAPGVDAVLHSTHSRYFEGSGRSRSPFAVPEEESITPSELAILDTLMSGGTALSLKAHFIDTLPDITPMSTTLVYLNLSFNNFQYFPLEVLDISNLEILKLRNNPLTELPPDIIKLKKLRVLIVSFCLLTALPLPFFEMPALEDLGLNYNKLTSLPNEISLLRTLKVLDLEGNQLHALPAGCLTLPHLTHVNLRNNFMHPLFWKDYSKNKPQRLLDLSCVQVYKSNLHKNLDLELRKDFISLLSRVEICDCCKGPMFGPGLKTICAVPRLFSIKNVPFLFRACTPECLMSFKGMNSEKLKNFLYSQ
uniref:Leucine-rich repeat-containing protein 63 n=1 Tax=Biomphalaria glabrata TaxID=6526 RepID=A0A2C9KTQ7_BIOGL